MRPSIDSTHLTLFRHSSTTKRISSQYRRHSPPELLAKAQRRQPHRLRTERVSGWPRPSGSTWWARPPNGTCSAPPTTTRGSASEDPARAPRPAPWDPTPSGTVAERAEATSNVLSLRCATETGGARPSKAAAQPIIPAWTKLRISQTHPWVNAASPAVPERELTSLCVGQRWYGAPAGIEPATPSLPSVLSQLVIEARAEARVRSKQGD
jgi:hypothetical protein